jgi:hypothetical protein
MGIKNAEFYADIKYTEIIEKSYTKIFNWQKLLPNSNIIE